MEQQEQQQESATNEPLIVGAESFGQAIESEENAPVEEAPKVEEKKEAIRIGDKTFETQQEAWDYADKIAQERLAQDAYRQGLQDAMEKQGSVTSQQQPEPEEDDFDEKFYSNPKQFLEEREAAIARKIREDLEREQAEKTKSQELWNKFYTSNSDLDGERDIVELTLQQNWDVLGKMTDHERAMKILAEKTREKIKKIVESRMPRQEMARTGDQVSSGGGQTVTAPKKEDGPVDFLTQINNYQKGRL